MALSFLLNNQPVKLEVNASFLSVVGDMDTGNATLEFIEGNNGKEPIAPGTKFEIYDDELDDRWVFIILNDDVEIVKKAYSEKQIYKHNISLVSNAQKLSKYALRNTVFTNTISENKVAKFNLSGIMNTVVTTLTDGQGFTFKTYEPELVPYLYPSRLGNTIADSRLVYYLNRVKVHKREKIRELKLKLSAEWYAATLCNFADNPRQFTLTGHGEGGSGNPACTVFVRVYNSATATTPLNQVAVLYDGRNNNEVIVPSSLYEAYSNQELWFDIAPSEDILPRIYHSSEDLSFMYRYGGDPQEPDDGTYPTMFGCIHAELNISTYYYTLYDVLDILQKQSCKYRYGGSTTRTPFTMMARDSEQGQELDKIIAPDFSFTSSNVFSAVAEVLSYIDAYPTLNTNGVLGYEYLNDYSKEEITDLKRTDQKTSLSFNDYADKFISKYQAGRQTKSIFYPAKHMFKRPSANNYGVPARDSYCFKVGHKIDYIDKVKIKAQLSDVYSIAFYTDTQQSPTYNPLTRFVLNNFLFETGEYDITDMVFPNDLYGQLPRANADTTFPSQLNTIYYERGNDYIYLGAITDTNGDRTIEEVYKKGLFWCIKNNYGIEIVSFSAANFPALYNLQLNVEYHAMYDGQISMESRDKKFDGEVEVAQANGNAQLNRMGSNMQGLIARSGNANKNVSLTVTPYGSRMKKGTIWVDDDGNKYIANKVKTTFSSSSQKTVVEAEFTKNFNLLTQFTKIDKEKRFYEIDGNITSKGYENLTEYIYFSYEELGDILLPSFEKTDLLELMFNNTFANSIYANLDNLKCVDFAIFSSYEFENDSDTKTLRIHIPTHVYGAGNMLCFEVGYSHPLNAVDRLETEPSVIPGITTILNKPCLYAGDDGFADKVLVQFLSSKDYNIFESNFPYIDANAPYEELFNSSDFRYYKKPNEIFHLNFEFAFLPYEKQEIFFGPKLIEENGLIRGARVNRTLNLYLYIGDTKYSIVDRKALSNVRYNVNYSIADLVYAPASITMGKKITFSVPSGSSATFSGKAWAICDENGDIYIACNQELTNANKVELWSFISRYKNH